MHNLTPKQKQVLDYLKEFISEHGHSPTLEQIRKRFRLRSLSNIHKHLTRLHEKGFITKENGKPHGISLTSRTLNGPSRMVPITGDIAPDGTLCENAGGPSMIDIPPTLEDGADSFALRIVGNPLPGSALQDGDLIVAHETGTARDGDLVLSEIDGRTRLTRAASPPAGEAGGRKAATPEPTVQAVVTGMLRSYQRKTD